MYLYKKYIPIFFLLFFILNGICSQTKNNNNHEIIETDAMLKKMITNLIDSSYFSNPLDEMKITFTFKIDSLGEVHSAHIRWSKNLRIKKYYPICHEIESSFNLKFLYHRFRREFINEKYVYCTFPYSYPFD